MRFVTSDLHQRHDPQFFLVRGKVGRSAEQPERARILKAAALAMGLEQVSAHAHDRSIIEKVHQADYLRFLEDASSEWTSFEGASAEVTANVHPNRIQASYPRSIVGRAGWHMADTACPIGPNTFVAAIASADIALTAALLIKGGEKTIYALCRPPGHHAYSDMAGGFCFLNNCAIAAEALRQTNDRVAILDIDVHHGNGTQEIFYERADILTLSVHTDPQDYYPFYWGYGHEQGAGEGVGANLNIPLPLGSTDTVWLLAIETAIKRVEEFAPTVLIVALGLDAHERDPLKGMSVSTSGFTQAAKLIAALKLPTLLVQEGGYMSQDLGSNLQAFLAGMR